MKVKVHGHLPIEHRLHIVAIGSFKPWQPYHEDLIRELAHFGQHSDQFTAIIWLTPSPQELLNPNSKAPPSNETAITSAETFLSLGIDTVLETALDLDDIGGDAFKFLNKIRENIGISELWLGKRQSLGSGPLGSTDAIRQYCSRAGIRLYRLDEAPSSSAKHLTRESL